MDNTQILLRTRNKSTQSNRDQMINSENKMNTSSIQLKKVMSPHRKISHVTTIQKNAKGTL
jgi:hypothetical protein